MTPQWAYALGQIVHVFPICGLILVCALRLFFIDYCINEMNTFITKIQPDKLPLSHGFSAINLQALESIHCENAIYLFWELQKDTGVNSVTYWNVKSQQVCILGV